MEVTQFRTCPLCEATCGLEITVRDNAVQRIRGDRADVFSHGFICPKGSTLKQLYEDPDRLRTPLIRRGEGHVQVTWDEAFAEIDRRLNAIIAAHGPNSVGCVPWQPERPHTGVSVLDAPIAAVARLEEHLLRVWATTDRIRVAMTAPR